MTRFSRRLIFWFALLLTGSAMAQPPAPSALEARAAKIILPKVELKEATIGEAIAYLLERSFAVDPEGGGFSVLVRMESAAPAATPPAPPERPVPIPGLDLPPGVGDAPPPNVPVSTRITLQLKDVPLTTAFRAVAELGHLQIRWDEKVVVVKKIPAGKNPEKRPVRPDLPITLETPAQKAAWEKMQKKMQEIVIPKVDFREATLREAVEYLQQRTKALDPNEDPEDSAFNLVLVDAAAANATITFQISNRSLFEIFRYVSEAADGQWTLKENGHEMRALQILLPKVELREATIHKALGYLQQQARLASPDGQAINIILKNLPRPAGVPDTLETTRITISLGRIPLSEALREVATLGSLAVRWDEHAVVLEALPLGAVPAPAAPRPPLEIVPDDTQKRFWQTLEKTKISKVDFREAEPREAWEYLFQRLKVSAADQPRPSSAIALEGGAPIDRPKISFYVTELPMIECLRYLAETSGLKLTLEKSTLTLAPAK